MAGVRVGEGRCKSQGMEGVLGTGCEAFLITFKENEGRKRVLFFPSWNIIYINLANIY